MIIIDIMAHRIQGNLNEIRAEPQLVYSCTVIHIGTGAATDNKFSYYDSYLPNIKYDYVVLRNLCYEDGSGAAQSFLVLCNDICRKQQAIASISAAANAATTLYQNNHIIGNQQQLSNVLNFNLFQQDLSSVQNLNGSIAFNLEFWRYSRIENDYKR